MRKTNRRRLETTDDRDIPPLTKAQKKELDRRWADMMDPIRYVIVSPFTRRHSLYYCVNDGTYIMNEIPEAALFKRKNEAMAVVKVIEQTRRKKRIRKSLQVIAVRKTNRGVQILDKVTSPWNSRQRWKPILKQPAKTRARFRKKVRRPG